jgi:beta-xylosidase
MKHVLGCCISGVILFSVTIFSQQVHRASNDAAWIPDNGDGTYKNPVIYADYSDPDVIRVGDDFYLIASSFAHFPGLPILHSKDLVNWKIINYAVPSYPYESFNTPQHGNGIWAPSLRYHNGEFYIYFGDPDRGIFMTKTKDPAGTWEPIKLIRKVTGWIDCCPLWDDDGNAYIIHAFANSRCGIKSILAVNKMNSAGTEIHDDGVIVFNGQQKHPTMEGPKFYKRNGYYYIFAPAGGVKLGWQVVMRSKNVFGPYEDKIVLEQGSTTINGPHQGGWVQTQTGEDWFLHFQDRYAYGRIVHLQPMRWEYDWPVMGTDYDGNGIGEPMLTCKKPNVGATYSIEVPQTSDEFDSLSLGLQWQWQANPNPAWYSLNARNGWLRLHAQALPSDKSNLWDAPNLLMQKFPALKFSFTTKLEFHPDADEEKSGVIIFGSDYAYIALEKNGNAFRLVQHVCMKADKGSAEQRVAEIPVTSASVYLHVDIKPEAVCTFSYSIDGKEFKSMGKEFAATAGRWVGAKVGIFSLAPFNVHSNGFADFDWVQVHN